MQLTPIFVIHYRSHFFSHVISNQVNFVIIMENPLGPFSLLHEIYRGRIFHFDLPPLEVIFLVWFSLYKFVYSGLHNS